MIPQAKFEEYLDFVWEVEETRFDEKPEDITVPKLIVIAGANFDEMAVIAFPNFGDYDNRRLTLRQVGQFCAREGKAVSAVYLVTEAYIVERTKEEYEEWMRKGKTPMPSEDPNRREILTVQGLAADGRTLSYDAEIIGYGTERSLMPKRRTDNSKPYLVAEFFDAYHNK